MRVFCAIAHCVVLCCVVLCCVVLCCVHWDSTTLYFPGRALFLLSYQGSSAGRALSLQHNTTQRNTTQHNTTQHKAKSNPNTLCYGTENPHLICRSRQTNKDAQLQIKYLHESSGARQVHNKQSNTNQDNTFFKGKKELPWVGLEPTTLCFPCT